MLPLRWRETNWYFFVVGGATAAAVAALVYYTGGIDSQFASYFGVIIIFAALYQSLVHSVLLGLTTILLSHLPLLYTGMQFDVFVRGLAPTAVYVAIFVVGRVTVSELIVRDQARNRAEADVVVLTELRDELDRINELEQKRVRQLHAVHSVGRLLVPIHDLQSLYNSLVEAARDWLGFDIVTLIVVDKEQLELQIVASVGIDRSHIPPSRRASIPWGDGIVGQVAMSGQPYASSDVRTISFDPLTGHPDTKSALAVPVKSSDTLLAVLSVESKSVNAFGSTDAMTLESVADHLAVAIENTRSREVLAHQAVTDMLTGLPNHRALMEHFDEEIERARRFNRKLSVLFLDIDKFKAVNDTFGHLSGDHVLRELAVVARPLLRLVDTFARYGGEEFVVLLPEVGHAEALAVAERLRLGVYNHSFVMDGGEDVQVMVSVGVATYPEDAASRHDLLRAADRALYWAKSSGRNKVASFIQHQGEPESVERRRQVN
ncbi:MAG: sensor domain-containing diguanylate cyclase [Chloroflexia bacterium]